MIDKSEGPPQVDNWPMILIDTSVLLVDPEVLVRVIGNRGLPFITNTILHELDCNKTNESQTVSRNAKSIYRIFAAESGSDLPKLPSGATMRAWDSLRQLKYNGSPVYVLFRRQYAPGSNNDGRIIEVARDYGMRIITRDNALKVRAECEGVTAYLWTGPTQKPRQRAKAKRTAPPRATEQARPFALPASPLVAMERPLPASTLPRDGNFISTGNGERIQLIRTLSAGGEGTIYRTDRPGLVCKIYHRDRLTSLRRQKIELMLTRHVQRPGICWPVDVALNDQKEFVGFLMPEAEGRPVQTCVFIKPVLEKTFPNWKRADLVQLCIAFLGHIEHLHSLNVLVGDINPLNLLVTSDSTKVSLVDTDSFQVEGFPCPVGTVNFTAPEIQGRNYATFLRTKDHELFAVATMLFMLLLPGKPPYAQQGGGDPGDNIRSGAFAYRFVDSNTQDPNQEHGESERQPASDEPRPPEGPWQLIWRNLPYKVREAFHRTFQAGERVPVAEWLWLMNQYRNSIEVQHVSNELFPIEFKIFDPIQAVCSRCSRTFTGSQKRIEQLRLDRKPIYCNPCFKQIRLEWLATRSEQARRGTLRSPPMTGEPKPASGFRATYRQSPPGTPWSRPTPRTGSPQRSQPTFAAPPSSRSGGGLFEWLKGLFR